MENLQLKTFSSRKDIVDTYCFPNKRQDEVDCKWFLQPLDHQLANFNKGLGKITYFITKKRDLEKNPYDERFEKPENQKDIVYEMITDYILLTELLHEENCDCGNCEAKNRATLYKLDGFNECYLGIGMSYGENSALIYDYEKIIQQLIQEGMSHEEAEEHFDYNILGSYIGEKMPIFLNRIPLDDLGLS